MRGYQINPSRSPKKLNNEIGNHGSDYVIFLWQNICGILKFHQFSEPIFLWLNLNFVINPLKTMFFSLKNPFLKHPEDNRPVALYGMNCYGYDRYGVKPSLPDCFRRFQPAHFRLRSRSRIELTFPWPCGKFLIYELENYSAYSGINGWTLSNFLQAYLKSDLFKCMTASS